MYEIWLGINILYEWCLMHPTVPLGMLATLVVAYAITIGQRKNWRAGLRPAMTWVILAFILLLFVYPMWVKSSIAEMRYSVDWINHLGICAGLAGFVGLVAWPILASARARKAL